MALVERGYNCDAIVLNASHFVPQSWPRVFVIAVRHGYEIHARLLTVREAARLMSAPDSFILPGCYNNGYKAMGDAVAMPVAQFIGEKFLTKLAEAVYND